MAPVWYNARKAAQVAAFFAKASGGKINVLKLVKLIYLADRLALETFESPVLNDKFVSMDHGPVNSITLNYVNGLSDDRDEWAEFITDRSGHLISLANPDLKIHDLDELSPAELKILELTWLAALHALIRSTGGKTRIGGAHAHNRHKACRASDPRLHFRNCADH